MKKSSQFQIIQQSKAVLGKVSSLIENKVTKLHQNITSSENKERLVKCKKAIKKGTINYVLVPVVTFFMLSF